jgi:putative ABC transport system substrate-binding protein
MTIGRREFVGLLGGAAAGWPLAALAQQAAIPMIGVLSVQTLNPSRSWLAAFRQGLGDAGYIEARNVTIQYRFADGQYDRLSAMALDLVGRQAAVIVAADTASALSAKAATAAIPIVFAIAGDPVRYGLVASLSQPGGNLTGVTNLNVEVGPKRLELMRELLPKAALIGYLENPTNPNAGSFTRNMQAAARTLGLQIHVLRASTEPDFDVAFAALAQLRAGGLVIGSDAFLTGRSEQLATLSVRYAMPAIYQHREFTAAGGLMSYGGSLTDQNRLAGIYTGRVLKGEKPADLPVQQSAIVELMINLRTAKALGLAVPLALLTRADEVIE